MISLFNFISVPIKSAKVCEIESPNPVPPKFLLIAPCSWLNGLNINFWFSLLIPIPLSCTTTSIVTLFSFIERTSKINLISPPIFVNFIALLKRLLIICLILKTSPRRYVGNCGSIKEQNFICFSFVLAAYNSMTDSISLIGSNSIFSISNFPDSIFEKSKISLIILNSD